MAITITKFTDPTEKTVKIGDVFLSEDQREYQLIWDIREDDYEECDCCYFIHFNSYWDFEYMSKRPTHKFIKYSSSKPVALDNEQIDAVREMLKSFHFDVGYFKSIVSAK